jgi:hypothetical protein
MSTNTADNVVSKQGYTVKGLKTFVGTEGEGFNATLYRDGKAVAFVIEDASGGPLRIEWKDRDAGLVKVAVKTWDGKPTTVGMTAEEKRLYKLCDSMPPVVCDFKDPNTGEAATLSMTADLFIAELVNDALLFKDIAKWTKGKIAAIKTDGKLYTFKAEPTEKNIATVKERNPGCVVLNGLSPLAAVAAVRAMN